MKRFTLVAICTLIMLISTQAQHALIPVPVKFESVKSTFVLDKSVVLDVKTSDAQVKQFVTDFQVFMKKAGVTLISSKANTGKTGRSIVINLNKTLANELGIEGYTLEVNASAVILTANDSRGIFNGLQTLRQLLPADAEGTKTAAASYKIPGCKITDYPRFGWRGLMLDVSRHFFTVDEVKAFIDKMAQYKFNVFHWHLTDDEGWRIEIKSLPKLTEIGAWRVERYGRFGDTRPYPQPGEKAIYGGFYTQEQIKDILKYAAARNITIVPEVDMPGHCMAALAAYPELSTKKEPKFVNPGSKFAEWYGGGKFKMLIENTLNPADEKVYEFVDKVFTEIAALFPGQFIHMGGDECYKGYWEEDASVQDFMKKNNIKDSHELQSYFVKRVEKIISSKGKKLIGWDEILEGGLAEGAAVMSWRGMDGGIAAAKMGHEVVMSPTTYAYLDYTQGDPSVENVIYASLSLEKTYSFEPIPEGVDPKLILGGQGNLWTEVIPNLTYAFYMTYPRAFALAETLWSPKANKNWNNFMGRTEVHFNRFDASGTNIAKAVYEPVISLKKNGERLTCELRSPVPGTEVFYTIDNTYPVQFGKKYVGPFDVPQGNLMLRTQTFRNGKPLGRELIIPRKDLENRAH